jgi:two-component system cell cycle response regulator
MRVVFVDPSRTAAMFVTRLLEAGHHDVKTFADGLEALAYIKSSLDVAVLITSAEPLSISGLELCWQTRLIATSHRPIYVIMMSGTTDSKMLIEALDSGADDFIGKPPVAEELYARLRAAERFCRMQRELFRLATTDSLTGVFNRRAFFTRAEEFCTRCEAGEMLSAVMLDIDHFKTINDSYGHDAGDEALLAAAQDMLAENAIVGRLGGEEFALLLHGRSMREGLAAAERLRAAIAARKIGSAGQIFGLTCSFGVSAWRDGDSIDSLLKRADMALYEAKLGGRNRVVAADRTMLTATLQTGGPVRNPAEQKHA